jgi:phage terminase small subunit
MKPERGLPMAAPARLKGHDLASEAWRRMMRMYTELESEIVTRLDQELLINYCMLVEQLGEIDLMRKTTYKMWLEIGVKHDQALSKIVEAKEAAEQAMTAQSESGVEMPEKGLGSLTEVEKWEDRAIALASKALDAFEAVVKLDGRADRKRALLYQLSQGLYLTPRARAGAAPTKKEEEPEKDPLEMLLDDVSNYVNGAGDAK